jgi:hypothetical protein
MSPLFCHVTKFARQYRLGDASFLIRNTFINSAGLFDIRAWSRMSSASAEWPRAP